MNFMKSLLIVIQTKLETLWLIQQIGFKIINQMLRQPPSLQPLMI